MTQPGIRDYGQYLHAPAAQQVQCPEAASQPSPFPDIHRLTQVPGPSQWPHRPQVKLVPGRTQLSCLPIPPVLWGLTKMGWGKDTARDSIMIQMINYIYTVNKYQ